MLGGIFKRYGHPASDLVLSKLYNEKLFYSAFADDLQACREEAIIESPFITSNRIAGLLPIIEKMRSRQVSITVNTRDPAEHNAILQAQAEDAIRFMQNLGVNVLYTGGHHRKLAILDRRVLWEGSLNILSQNESCEIMRRIDSPALARQMISFTKLKRYL